MSSPSDSPRTHPYPALIICTSPRSRDPQIDPSLRLPQIQRLRLAHLPSAPLVLITSVLFPPSEVTSPRLSPHLVWLAPEHPMGRSPSPTVLSSPWMNKRSASQVCRASSFLGSWTVLGPESHTGGLKPTELLSAYCCHGNGGCRKREPL